MKTSLMICALILATHSLVAADSASTVKAAAKKLQAAGGYAWKMTSESPNAQRSRFGPSEGKISKDGTIHLVMPGREGSSMEAVMKGKKGAVKGEEEWQSLSEAAESEGRIRFLAGMLQNFRPPADEALELVDKIKDLKAEGDTYSGDMTPEGVKALLSRWRRPGGDAPEVSDPKGSAKFWVKDGALSKFEFNLQGKMNFNGNDVDINRTTTVEIKDVGSTEVKVPEAAAKKMS
jgi:hypothetical protein